MKWLSNRVFTLTLFFSSRYHFLLHRNIPPTSKTATFLFIYFWLELACHFKNGRKMNENPINIPYFNWCLAIIFGFSTYGNIVAHIINHLKSHHFDRTEKMKQPFVHSIEMYKNVIHTATHTVWLFFYLYLHAFNRKRKCVYRDFNMQFNVTLASFNDQFDECTQWIIVATYKSYWIKCTMQKSHDNNNNKKETTVRKQTVIIIICM